MAVSGEIVDNDGSGADTMTFSGYVYRDTGYTFAGTNLPLTDPTIDGLELDFQGERVCVVENRLDNITVNFPGGGPPPTLNLWNERNDDVFTEPRVWMSSDGGVTWSDITATIQDASNLPGPFIQFLYGGVDAAPNDENWLAIGGGIYLPPCDYDFTTGTHWFGSYPDRNGAPAVVASNDGAGNFSYSGDMQDSSAGTWMERIYGIAVSPEVSDIHNVAVAGYANVGTCFDGATDIGTVYRLEAGTWLGGSWKDTSFYDGWDDGIVDDGLIDPEFSDCVAAVGFSPNFDMDDSIVTMGVSYILDVPGPTGDPVDWLPLPFLQEGLFESGGTWNGEAGFPDAVQIKNDGNQLLAAPILRTMGFALPADFDGVDSGANNIYLYVDAYDVITELVGGYVMICEDGALSLRCGPSSDPLLASIDVHGDADSAKAMIGSYVNDFTINIGDRILETESACCAGVAVYHTVELDDCCPEWEGACKDPSWR